jgi:hypothetical protein
MSNKEKNKEDQVIVKPTSIIFVTLPETTNELLDLLNTNEAGRVLQLFGADCSMLPRKNDPVILQVNDIDLLLSGDFGPAVKEIFNHMMPFPGWRERIALLTHKTGRSFLPNSKRGYINNLVNGLSSQKIGTDFTLEEVLDFSMRPVIDGASVTFVGTWEAIDFRESKIKIPKFSVKGAF